MQSERDYQEVEIEEVSDAYDYFGEMSLEFDPGEYEASTETDDLYGWAHDGEEYPF